MATVTDLPMPRLGGGATDFARRGGQLRVSLTPHCQLGCWFCHNEGEIPPRITRRDRTRQPRPRALAAGDFLTAITAMTDARIRRVFFTGGEPLLSPLARPVLEGMPEHDPARYTTTLITNGLTLTRDLPWLAATSRAGTDPPRGRTRRPSRPVPTWPCQTRQLCWSGITRDSDLPGSIPV